MFGKDSSGVLRDELVFSANNLVRREREGEREREREREIGWGGGLFYLEASSFLVSPIRGCTVSVD